MVLKLPLCAVLGVLAADPVAAQSLLSIVVPADAAVVVAPRGQPAPRPALPMAPSIVPPVVLTPIGPPAASLGIGLGLAGIVPALVPVAAALVLGAGTPGSGGSSNAPANTR